MVTGNPVREAFLAKRTPAYTVSADKPLHILITGGSQGAKSFSTLFPAVMERLSAEQRRAIVLTQQCRAEDIDAVRDAYARLSVGATLATFFHDMPEQIATCDLFIGRAGASTIAEVTTIGRAGVYIPYPYAMDDHQAANAERVVAAGAGWLYRQEQATPEALTALITSLQADRSVILQKAQAAAKFAHVDAVKSLVNLLDDSLR
jgi:UDP-N-acetylglucosamine--N-acetylmuramyl-(pentapeptide) pyrophosphoryl-undecaprenol N-acetylglucosamine transferase